MEFYPLTPMGLEGAAACEVSHLKTEPKKNQQGISQCEMLHFKGEKPPPAPELLWAPC